MDGYVPPLLGLPLFVWRLATQVDWAQEQQCFEGIARQLARFYRLDSLQGGGEGEGGEAGEGGEGGEGGDAPPSAESLARAAAGGGPPAPADADADADAVVEDACSEAWTHPANPNPDPGPNPNPNPNLNHNHNHIHNYDPNPNPNPNQAWTIQHLLLPAIRKGYEPPSVQASNGTVVQVACTELTLTLSLALTLTLTARWCRWRARRCSTRSSRDADKG